MRSACSAIAGTGQSVGSSAPNGAQPPIAYFLNIDFIGASEWASRPTPLGRQSKRCGVPAAWFSAQDDVHEFASDPGAERRSQLTSHQSERQPLAAIAEARAQCSRPVWRQGRNAGLSLASQHQESATFEPLIAPLSMLCLTVVVGSQSNDGTGSPRAWRISISMPPTLLSPNIPTGSVGPASGFPYSSTYRLRAGL